MVAAIAAPSPSVVKELFAALYVPGVSALKAFPFGCGSAVPCLMCLWTAISARAFRFIVLSASCRAEVGRRRVCFPDFSFSFWLTS